LPSRVHSTSETSTTTRGLTHRKVFRPSAVTPSPHRLLP
jgi:hypothetical protein